MQEHSTIPAGVEHFDSLPPSAFVSVKAVAAILNKHQVTVWRWSKPGGPLFPPTRLGPNSVGWNVGKLRERLAAMQSGTAA